MSYCRLGPDSDVYAIRHVDGGYRCCGCSLTGLYNYTVHIATPTELLLHLQAHRAAGDMVPRYAMDRLRDEIREYGRAGWAE